MSRRSFNTASGKCCCNCQFPASLAFQRFHVSIPQAVSAVATKNLVYASTTDNQVSIPQAVSAVATFKDCVVAENVTSLFQYRKR